MIMAADTMSLNNLLPATGTLLLPQGVAEKGNTLDIENAGDETHPALHQEWQIMFRTATVEDVSHDSEAPSPNC